MACGLGCVFLYLSFQISIPDTSLFPKFFVAGTDVMLIRQGLGFIHLEPKELFFQSSLVFFILCAMRLIEAIGLWFDQNWASYLTIASALIYVILATYLLNQKFSWFTLIAVMIALLISAYLIIRLIKKNLELNE